MTSCAKPVVKYERVPFLLSNEVTDPVLVDEVTEKTDLVEYTLNLLGKVDQMNIDRQTVRKAVEAHNAKQTETR